MYDLFDIIRRILKAIKKEATAIKKDYSQHPVRPIRPEYLPHSLNYSPVCPYCDHRQLDYSYLNTCSSCGGIFSYYMDSKNSTFITKPIRTVMTNENTMTNENIMMGEN